MGFFYYSGTWLMLLFGGASNAILLISAIFNLLCIPYTFYSIYYQAHVAKQWCILCCSIQILIWLEFVIDITYAKNYFLAFNTTLDGTLITNVIISLIVPVILWIIFKPLILSSQQQVSLKSQLRVFKYNTHLFNIVIKEQPKYIQPSEEWCIVFGDTKASNIITMVTNPYCEPCSKTHMLLEELLEQNRDLQARIVFTANNTDSDFRTPVSRHLMELNNLQDRMIIRNALNDWYSRKQKSYPKWAENYPISIEESALRKIDEQNAWCQMTAFKSTPTILLNGFLLPNFYSLVDLKYLLK